MPVPRTRIRRSPSWRRDARTGRGRSGGGCGGGAQPEPCTCGIGRDITQGVSAAAIGTPYRTGRAPCGRRRGSAETPTDTAATRGTRCRTVSRQPRRRRSPARPVAPAHLILPNGKQHREIAVVRVQLLDDGVHAHAVIVVERRQRRLPPVAAHARHPSRRSQGRGSRHDARHGPPRRRAAHSRHQCQYAHRAAPRCRFPRNAPSGPAALQRTPCRRAPGRAPAKRAIQPRSGADRMR